MSILHDQQVLPYTGIQASARVGIAVDECTARIGRFGFVAKQLMLVQAAKLSSTTNWEFKAALGRHLWEAAVHWGVWRERIAELRGHEHLIEHHSEGQLNDLFLEILTSSNDAELAIALYEVVLPAYQTALQRYLAETNPLVDQPTVRAIRYLLLDLEDQVTFGQSVLQAIVETAQPALAAWHGHLTAYLNAAGGIDGTGPTQPAFELPAPRSTGEYRIPGVFARDERFTTTLPKLNPYAEETVSEALLSKMWVRSQEMTAAELCATVLFEWEELPYEGYLDLARHCWDEVRHSLFGQAALAGEGVALESVPSWVGYAAHTMPAYPQKRYAHLTIATEANAMRHPGGKRGEWEWCKDKADHPLMTVYQDFDWADEVNHVAYGRKWLIRHFGEGDRKRAEAMADETVAERLAYYQQFAAKPTAGY